MTVIIINSYDSDIASLIDLVGTYGYNRGSSGGTFDRRSVSGNSSETGIGVTFEGTGFTYADELNIAPSGGNVTSIRLDIDNFTEANISGLYLPFPNAYQAFRDSAASLFDLFGSTIFVGAGGRDRIALGSGDDDLRMGDGNDFASGGAGNDKIDGGTGTDRMDGGAGNDKFYVDTRADVVVEAVGGGYDEVIASASYTLRAGVEVESLITASPSSTTALDLIGNEFGQRLIGNAGANTLNGLGGNDTLYGGLGNDKLYGGTGDDSFVFNTQPNTSTNADAIFDFSNVTGNNDRILLENAVFTKLTATGKLSADFLAMNATGTAKDGNDFVVYNTGNGKLFYDADGSGAGAAVLVATLVGKPPLAADDFTVI